MLKQTLLCIYPILVHLFLQLQAYVENVGYCNASVSQATGSGPPFRLICGVRHSISRLLVFRVGLALRLKTGIGDHRCVDLDIINQIMMRYSTFVRYWEK